MVIDEITEIVYHLSLRCPAFAQNVATKQSELYRATERYFNQHSTLPIGPGKCSIFREGRGIRWSDMKNSVLNNMILDNFKKYIKAR